MSAAPQPRGPVPPECSRRMNALGDAVREVINRGTCTWTETACAVAFELALVIDAQADDARRIRMAEVIAQKLVSAAWVPGSYGIAERMQ